MVFYPGQAQFYTAVLPRLGDASIQTVASWTFTDAAVAMTVTGTRITVFSFRPDWSDPWRETTSYLTEILPAYDGTEQRRALRQIPRSGATFRVLTCSPGETAALETMVYGWQAQAFGVPWWPETSLLRAAADAGDRVLQVDTTDHPAFMVDGLVMVWLDFATWEAFRVTGVSAGSLELASQVTRPWPAGARVVPVRRGRLGDQPLDRPANWLTSGTFSFTCEAV